MCGGERRQTVAAAEKPSSLRICRLCAGGKGGERRGSGESKFSDSSVARENANRISKRTIIDGQQHVRPQRLRVKKLSFLRRLKNSEATRFVLLRSGLFEGERGTAWATSAPSGKKVTKIILSSSASKQ